MLYPILAKLGIPWAKKHKALTDEKILRNALVALGKPGVQLSAEAVRTIRGYTTEAIEAMGDYSHAAWHFQAVGFASEGAILSVENMPGGALKSNSPKITIAQDS